MSGSIPCERSEFDTVKNPTYQIEISITTVMPFRSDLHLLMKIRGSGIEPRTNDIADRIATKFVSAELKITLGCLIFFQFILFSFPSQKLNILL